MRTLVLLSGGMDSTACIHYYLALGFDVTGFFINYGQLAAIAERNSAVRVCSHYGAEFVEANCHSARSFGVGEIKGRNVFLVANAMMNFPDQRGIISLGIHRGTDYFDCSEEFVRDMKRILDGYYSGTVVFEAPFAEWTKRDIYNYCKENHVPIELTYSCQRGVMPPCGHCRSCLDIRGLREDFHV
jgi:7-cyano-7-deazaguanine synthase